MALIDKIPDEPAKSGEFILPELMAIQIAHQVRNDDIVFAGTGLPMVGIMTANMLNAPNALLIYEAGICDGKTMHVPMSVCDQRAANMSSSLGGLVDTFGFFLQQGFVSLGFLGGAAIDKYGGVNVTSIGDYWSPAHRFTGSGGNSDIGTLSKRVAYIILQEKRRFLERNEYTTTPGWWCWDFKKNEWRPKKEVWKGTPFADSGPVAVVTNMGVYKFDEFFGPRFDFWVAQNHKRVAFRVMCQSMHSAADYVTPKWVFDKGVPGVQHTALRGQTQTDPVFWDERYLEVQGEFIRKLGEYLDGRPGLEFVDIGSIGEWGEMHLMRWTPQQLAETGYTEAKYVAAYRRVSGVNVPIATVVTDSRLPGEPKETTGSALFQIFQAFASPQETARFRQAFEAGIGWGEAKERLFERLDRELDNLDKESSLTAPIAFQRLGPGRVAVELNGQRLELSEGQWSDWAEVTFELNFLVRLRGFCRFIATRIAEDVKIFMSPVEIHPEEPVLPISWPGNFAARLARNIGLFKTRGWAAETAALKLIANPITKVAIATAKNR